MLPEYRCSYTRSANMRMMSPDVTGRVTSAVTCNVIIRSHSPEDSASLARLALPLLPPA
jgi:hypothetical protein